MPFILQSESGLPFKVVNNGDGTVSLIVETNVVNSVAIFEGNKLTGDVTLSASGSAVLQSLGNNIVVYAPPFEAASAIDHNQLANLTVGDPHTQYALLAGRSGGQSLNGDTAASGNLTLDSTANATKGLVIIAPSTGKVVINNTTPDTGALLDVAGHAGGIGFPPLTNAQRGAITVGREGIVIWNSDNRRFEYTLSGTWAVLSPTITDAQETPSGLINSSNVTYTLSQFPRSNASVILFLGPSKTFQVQGTDYTISGQTITMNAAPTAGPFIAKYQY